MIFAINRSIKTVHSPELQVIDRVRQVPAFFIGVFF
jgi:hypothetical protein